MSEIKIDGKWSYKEDYGYGIANGELTLFQDGNKLSGKIIISDTVEGEGSFMIMEIIKGTIEERKVKIYAVEYDIIHADYEMTYELDNWFGVLVDDNTIVGVSKDEQGIEGKFKFNRL